MAKEKNKTEALLKTTNRLEKHGYYRSYKYLLENYPDIEAPEALAFGVLDDLHRNPQVDHIYISALGLAKKVKVKETKIRKIIKVLKKYNLIIIHERPGTSPIWEINDDICAILDSDGRPQNPSNGQDVLAESQKKRILEKLKAIVDNFGDKSVDNTSKCTVLRYTGVLLDDTEVYRETTTTKSSLLNISIKTVEEKATDFLNERNGKKKAVRANEIQSIGEVLKKDSLVKVESYIIAK